MTGRWIPGDDELDVVARTLEMDPQGADRAEHNRTAILAAAATRTQQARRSAAPLVVAGIAIAAAAAVVLVIAARTAAPTSGPIAQAPRQLVTPIGAARFERVTDWPDYVVRVDDGTIAVQVDKLAAAERFRVKTADAEVLVRGTRFEVGVETGRLISVVVHEGRVEVRLTDQQVVILSAGERWAPMQTAQHDAVELPAPTPEVLPPGRPAATTVHAPASKPMPPTGTASAAHHVSATNHAVASDRATASAHATRPLNERATLDRSPPASNIEPPHTTSNAHDADARVAPPARASPGEAEFRAGWAALRAGDPAAAASAFAAACNTAQSDAIGEDACFWAGAAAKRAGDVATARAALSQFVRRFTTSPRAAEASALLGWILYDAGELDAAEQQFHQAEHDRVPKVRDSATRGLTAIDRKRHGTP